MTQEEFFSRYKYDRTKDRIGGGGFGNVYKVFDTIENETVALKIAEVKQGQESLSLLKEVELASSLKRHVNIARYTACYRFDLPNGHFDFGILQYYPLGNLSQFVKSKKLNYEEKEQIAKGVISGIQHLHSNNVVHRDLKSANILIAEGYQGEYVPKIADFGLSKQFAQNENSYFSNSFAGGSLLYVAPEQLEGKELRKNVDLWSLGVVLYELFLGDTPFRANVDDGSETARAEIISKIRNATLPASITSVPSPWQEIIRGCLVTNPSNRIKSIEEVQDIVNGKANTKKEIDRTEVDTGSAMGTKKKVYYENEGDRNESTKGNPLSGWLVFLLISLVLSYMVWWGLGDNLGGDGGRENSEISQTNNNEVASKPNQEEEKILLEVKEKPDSKKEAKPKDTKYSSKEKVKSIKNYGYKGGFSEGLAVVEQNGKWGFIDKSEKEIIPLIYNHAYYFSEGLAAVKLNGKRGFIDKTGREIIQIKYDDVGVFSEGLASVKQNGKWGFIDKSGKEIIPLLYNRANYFSEGLVIVELNGKSGYIDQKGREIIPFKYDAAKYFSEGLASVKQNGKWSLIDKSGREVNTVKYDMIESFSDGLAVVTLNGKSGYIDKTGREIIPFKYDHANYFSEGLALVGINGKYFRINKLGECAKDCHNSPVDHSKAN